MGGNLLPLTRDEFTPRVSQACRLRQGEGPGPFVSTDEAVSGHRVPPAAVNMAEELQETVERLQSRLLENPEPRKVTRVAREVGRLVPGLEAGERLHGAWPVARQPRWF